MELSLDTPVQFLTGVGPRRAALLARLGIETASDLLWYLPRDVLDLTEVTPPSDLKDGVVQTVRGRVVDLDGRLLAHGKSLSCVLIDCGGEYVRGVWFNQSWVLKKFQPQALVLFSGKPKRQSGRWEFSHPRVQWLGEDDAEAGGGVLPRYGLTDGLAMHELRRITRTAVDELAELVPDVLPSEFRSRVDLPPIAEALRGIHAPGSLAAYERGRRRLIYQDLLEFQLGLALRQRAVRRRSGAMRLPCGAKVDARIRRLFPFTLTDGQNRAISEICRDLDSGWSMQRLLQADVGAGKTAVAVYAMLVAVAAGYQAVLMAPTELLANQHWQSLDRLLSHSRVVRGLFTGQLSGAERQRMIAEIRQGTLQLVVGTQAVIQDAVEFGKLGLVIIDEQHKFGVRQRARFAAGGGVPHTLVMTATPIPRSLCLTQFGDLDLSVIDELPPGRQKIVTSRVSSDGARSKAWEFLRQKLHAGRQAYIVCPRIGGDRGSERLDDDAAETSCDPPAQDRRSAEAVFQDLREGELKGFRVGLLHGSLPSDLKQETMRAFRNSELDALVSTTVVEVGVDVPNATLMVIEHAESFGLAQLHQLRGRIGRGRFQGYCFLMSSTESAEALSRLAVLERHASGFEVAEADFQLRGPGDILGTRQHGELPLRVADLARDADVLVQAREMAFQLVGSGEFDSPEFRPLKAEVMERFGDLFEIAGSG